MKTKTKPKAKALPPLWWETHFDPPLPKAAVMLIDPASEGHLKIISTEALVAARHAMDSDGLQGLASWLKIDQHIARRYRYAVQWFEYLSAGGQYPIQLPDFTK